MVEAEQFLQKLKGAIQEVAEHLRAVEPFGHESQGFQVLIDEQV